MKARLVGLVLAAVVASSAAGADESAPSLTLSITPAATGPWTLKIANDGDTPVRLAADPRLLSLEVGKERCVLPDDARPSSDEGSELVVPGKRAWSTSFDPLFYCFGAKERTALVSGATVKAHFGWRATAAKRGAKTPPSQTPPFVAAPVGASVGRLGAVKELDAAPITLSDSVVVQPKPATEPASVDDPLEAPQARVSLSVPAAMDAARGADLSTTVTVHNESDRAITLMFRPDMVQFTVQGPRGTFGCGSPKAIASPMRELFVTVGAKGQTSLSVLFTATCGTGSFDEPGIYRLNAKLDTRQASGRPINLKSWDGVAISKEPLLLRVREARHPEPGRKAQLD